MSDGDDGSRLTRRRILAGVGGAAGVGLIGGAGTRAFLRDTETIPGSLLGNPYEGARVNLRLRCGNDACTAEENGDGVSFAFEGIEPGSSGSTTVCPGLGKASKPAWMWFRTTPQVDTLLAEELTVTFAYADGTPVPIPESPDTDETEAENISLKVFLSAFNGGTAVPGSGVGDSDEAFTPDEEHCLKLSWSLPDAPDPGISEQSVEFTLRFAAVQYRANATASNPWKQ